MNAACFPARENNALAAALTATFGYRLSVRLSQFLVCFSAALVSNLPTLRAEKPSPLRTLTVDDIMQLEAVTDVTLSPTGGAVAFVRWPPIASAWANGRSRGVIWVIQWGKDGAPGEPMAIQAESDQNSYYGPKWSPDGSKLAMVFFEFTSGWHLAVWDSRTNQLTKLGDKNTTLTFAGMRGFAWVDNERLVSIAEDSQGNLISPSAATSSAWAIAERQHEGVLNMLRGEHPTSHVLESGLQFDPKAYPQESLVLLDVNGETQKLATGVHIAELQAVSPDRHHVAFLRQIGRRTINNATHFDYNYDDFGENAAHLVMEITDLDGHIMQYSAGMQPAAIRGKTLRWSLDGMSFAYLGSCDGATRPHIYRGTISGTLEEVYCGANFIPRLLLWTRDGLAIEGNVTSVQGTVSRDRLEWWFAGSHGVPKLLTGALNSVPQSLQSMAGGRLLIGEAAGAVWRFDLDTQTWTNLTGSSGLQVAELLTLGHSTRGDTVLFATDENVPRWLRLNIASGVQNLLPLPSPKARPVAYEDVADVAVFQAVEDSGTYLTVRQNELNQHLFTVNRQLDQIIPAKERLIHYTGEDGQELTGWLLLPPDYTEGKRYPLVTWVYAGENYSSRPPAKLDLNPNTPARGFNFQLFSARGYAVLLPSMPLPPRGQASDVYLELTKGVIPAVNEVIRIGIADPQRLAVGGHSFGGFSVNGLVTQTTRFQAAISWAGDSDFVSAFGAFAVDKRYRDLASSQDVNFQGMQVVEAGQGHLGTPWLDSGRYLRNSPVMYADRIVTPLLLIHGDMDTAVPIQQSDEMFSALMRQGKRVRYVQYNGEGHVILSPANVRDMWQQMFDWLDHYLAPVPEGK